MTIRELPHAPRGVAKAVDQRVMRRECHRLLISRRNPWQSQPPQIDLNMTDDEEQIRRLIERWAETVHRGDLSGVLADHSDDIVMSDVPPPHEGVHGIDAYREMWPPFFEWQAQGASFEIVSPDVSAGDDVAYAHALLRVARRRSWPRTLGTACD
jgi:ketosteroid isomerase-like protein